MSTAFGYVREKTKSEVEEQTDIILEYYEAAIAPLGVAQGRSFGDRPEARHKNFLARDAARKCMQHVKAGDHLIVPRMAIAFVSHADFAAAWDKLTERGICLHIANL